MGNVQNAIEFTTIVFIPTMNVFQNKLNKQEGGGANINEKLATH